ncbi:MAG: hypothetical protein QXV94_06260 [Thermoplasmata archaeon]
MGTLEFEMERDRMKPATRYVVYYAKLPGHHIDIAAMTQVFVDEFNIPGTKSNILGRNNNNLPDKIKVTIEWEDINEETLKE